MKSPEKEAKCLIGNDILSKKDISNQLSFSKKKYLDKILTADEQLLVAKKIKIEQLPFVLWTCKESAYKIDLKDGLNKGFIPNEYEVEIESLSKKKGFFVATGNVNNGKKTFFSQTKIFPDYISTIACNSEKDLPKIQNFIGENNKCDHSVELRRLLKKKLAQHFRINENDIAVMKSEKGIPYIVSKYCEVLPDISFSHDGDYFSYAVLLN